MLKNTLTTSKISNSNFNKEFNKATDNSFYETSKADNLSFWFWVFESLIDLSIKWHFIIILWFGDNT